ncbi:Vacuolar protein-sorting-associated protein 27 [Podila epigama]|nr:Vacuolar protein-sorting-associated protein 27 [Podila epigama]
MSGEYMDPPPMLWGMDPLFHVSMQLMIGQVKKLVKVADYDGMQSLIVGARVVYRHHTHPVRSVEVMGMVRRVQRRTASINYALDDGTGVLQCIMWIPDECKILQDTSHIPGLRVFELGQVIRVRGIPGEYKGDMQLVIKPGDMSLCSDPNDETTFRLEVLNKERFVYTQPVILPDYDTNRAQVTGKDANETKEWSMTTLFKAMKDWVACRQQETFSFMDLEDDPTIAGIAMTLAAQGQNVQSVHTSARALRLVANTVQDLIQEGSIEVRDKDRMTLGARTRPASLSAAELQVIELDSENLIRQVIDLYDTSDEDKRATSENLPAGSEDLALNLEICDQIRSKQVPAKEAAQALKRRIGHKNPNVQLLALGLTDVCVKNGGHHFLVEIAAREFIDNLTSILKAPSGCNFEVKTKILSLIQTWGILFRGKHGLGYVCDTYMILQHEGFPFQAAENIGTALVESEAVSVFLKRVEYARALSP